MSSDGAKILLPGVEGPRTISSEPRRRDGTGGFFRGIHESLLDPDLIARTFWAFVKFLVGVVNCLSPLGSILTLGWTSRLMQRAALKKWWNLAGPAGEQTFHEFLASDSRTAVHQSWPNWMVDQNFREALRSRETFLQKIGALFSHGTMSLRRNIVLGLQMAFNVFLFTLPGSVLWVFAWYDGFNNSFTKGYEQAWVGPATFWLGILAFAAAMFYVPMAQARQAITGNWKAFYDFRLVWSLVRQRWIVSVGLAALYSAAAFPVMLMASVPTFFPGMFSSLTEDASPDKVKEILTNFYLVCGFYVFPAFVILRGVAAKIYATAVVKAVRSGRVREEHLDEFEWQVVERLGLLEPEWAGTTNRIVALARATGSRFGRMAAGMATALIWISIPFQKVVAQFLHFRTSALDGWLIHPLIQAPWFRNMPDRLVNPWGELALAAAILLVGWLVVKVSRKTASLTRSLRRG